MPNTKGYPRNKKGKEAYISDCVKTIKKESPGKPMQEILGKCFGLWKSHWNAKGKEVSEQDFSNASYWTDFSWENCTTCQEFQKVLNKKLGIFELDIPNQIFASEKMDKVTVNLKEVVPQAVEALKKYFAANKAKYTHEKEHSGVDGAKSPLAYFKQELKEHMHKDVRDEVDKTGILTLPLYNRWQTEEEKEED